MTRKPILARLRKAGPAALLAISTICWSRPTLANSPAAQQVNGAAQSAGRGAVVDFDTSFHTAFLAWRSHDKTDATRSVITVSRAGDGLGAPVVWRNTVNRQSFGPSQSASSAAMPNSLPLRSSLLTSGFGWRAHPLLGGYRMHTGIDLAAPFGTPVFAPSDGMVSVADWRGGYGLLVEVEHGAGIETRFGHLSRIAVAPGQAVRKGQMLGLVGSTGRSTGPHLHYEVRRNGQAINPLRRWRNE